MVKRFVVGALIIMLLAGAAYAQEEKEIEPVVVTASRLFGPGLELNRVPANVVIVTEEDIERLGARTVGEVLKAQAGIILYDLFGNSFQASLDMRGFNGQPVTATTVLVDGVRVNEPDFNQINFDLIPVDEIKRIEIIPGTSAMFGKNAMAGVINIVTKRGEAKGKTLIELSGGSFARQKYRLATSGMVNDLDYHFGITRELGEGFRDESEARITRLLAKLGYSWGEASDLALSYTHVNDKLGQAGSLPPTELARNRRGNLTPGDFVASEMNALTLNYKQGLPYDLFASVNGFFRGVDRDSLIIGLSSLSKLETNVNSAGATLQLNWERPLLARRNSLFFGVEFSSHRFNNKSESVFSGFPFFGRNRTDEVLLGLFVQDTFDLLDKLSLTLGLRYDRDRLDFTDQLDPDTSGIKTFRRFSPRAGLVYRFSDKFNVYLNYAEGFRIPTVDELFAFGPFFSNPDLKPVKSSNYEIGLRANWGKLLSASVAVFDIEVRDEIFFVVTDLETFSGSNENVKKARRRGVEFSLKGNYKDSLSGFLNYTLTEATFQTDITLFTFPIQNVGKGDEFPLVPRHRLSAGISYRFLDNWAVSVNGLYVSDQFLLNDEANQREKLDSYFLLNARVAFEKDGFSAFLQGNNLTDERYETFGIFGAVEPFLVPGAGISVLAGVAYEF
ncbi:MAG: TonB-dependent receptor [Thermodesulfobacteriota bacterium]